MGEPKATDAASASAPQPSNPPPPPPPTTTTTTTTPHTQTQTSQPPPPPPPPPPKTTTITTTTPSSTTSVPPPTKKRPLEPESESDDAHSNYFKIRAVIRDLRPHFIEVLRTPDYKNCKASQEIRDQLKIVVKLYDNMKAEAVSLGKSKQEGQPPSGQNLDHKTQPEQQPQHVKSPEQKPQHVKSPEQKPQHVKSPEQIQVEKSFAKSSEIKVTPPAPGLQKLQAEDGQGTYVVGGSAFGWNFITFSGKEAVYYGRTKEQFRAAQVAQ